ncbi:hypothetical protein FE257_005683 [Aspergillus nanangensis]|uniref:Uncharacterized protein n=1 Tax=Aspergillus nanangensis TaxID=2582783 RepID=A0AAD4CRT5_ASPNN|nr:hypothetical protein FE257_005683 [Aspergillus nanangensis]
MAQSAKPEGKGLLNRDLHEKSPDWQPGMIRQIPWLELAQLFVALLCAVLAIVVLTLSDGKNVDDWADIIQVRPNILVAILTTISTIASAAAVSQGVAIAWWRRAMHPTTISHLQRSWDHANSVMACLTAGNKLTILALATLATKLMPVDSVLLQRATSTGVRTMTRDLNVSSSLATEFPSGYQSALMTGSAYYKNAPTVFTSGFSSSLRAYQSLGSGAIDPFAFGSRPLFTGCSNGTCEYSVEGVGFAAECASSTLQIDYGENTTKGLLGNDDNLALPRDAPIFINSFALVYPPMDDNAAEINNSFIRMTSQYMQSTQGKSTFTCPGTLTTKTCDLRPAVIRYALTQTPAGITLGGNTTSSIVTHTRQVDNNSFVRYLYQNMEDGWIYSLAAIGGVQLALSALLSANVTLSANSANQPYYLDLSGPLAPYYVSVGQDQGIGSGRCNYTIQDPSAAVMRQLNTIMLLASMQIASANESIPVQTARASQTLPVQYYITHYGFLAGGIAVVLVSLLGVVVPYYGFWELGRKVTLGPFETANALQAPLLQSGSGSSSGGVVDVLEQVGERPLQYGVVASGEEELAFATPENVRSLHM